MTVFHENNTTTSINTNGFWISLWKNSVPRFQAHRFSHITRSELLDTETGLGGVMEAGVVGSSMTAVSRSSAISISTFAREVTNKQEKTKFKIAESKPKQSRWVQYLIVD